MEPQFRQTGKILAATWFRLKAQHFIASSTKYLYTQNDVVLGTLTVRENLWFSANLRLKQSVTKAEKESKVENVIKELGLTACADTKVGLLNYAYNSSITISKTIFKILFNYPQYLAHETTLSFNTRNTKFIYFYMLSLSCIK